MTKKTHPGSFRDPSGFIFIEKGNLYRQINYSYRSDYDLLMSSGLYETLTEEGSLISHEEISFDSSKNRDAYKVIKPAFIPFISYSYEWSFSQLKDAALLTLAIQKRALKVGLSLKDASAYNVQFLNGKPVMIDTLSFAQHINGEPWIAYKQFCQHFLAPLALMSYRDIRLSSLLKTYIDGIPLDLAANLLPFRSYFKYSLLSHIYLHAKSQRVFADKVIKKENPSFSLNAMYGLIDSLESAIRNLKWKPEGTEWYDYYSDTNYSESGHKHKKELVSKYIQLSKPKTVWDLGANDGIFSRLASDESVFTLSIDSDPAAVENNYLNVRKQSETKILPLLIDLTNPSPAIGWKNDERSSILERGPADTAMALALIHHLAISNNLPLGKTAELFSKICNYLIIEFVPKNDSQVQKLLASREDIFQDYDQTEFERVYAEYFTILNSDKIIDSERTIYLMKNNSPKNGN